MQAQIYKTSHLSGHLEPPSSKNYTTRYMLVSGMVGIGGGIFLSPILFLLKAEKPKTIVTTASLFILINSISGVLGQLTKENVLNEIFFYWPLFFAVLAGGLFGNYLNLKIFSNRLLAIITSLLVIFVAIRMAFKIFF